LKKLKNRGGKKNESEGHGIKGERKREREFERPERKGKGLKYRKR
jgi:hypothetical protein